MKTTTIKTIIATTLLAGSMMSTVCADELRPQTVEKVQVNATQSKLEQIQAKIDEYQKYIRELPEKMKVKEEQFNRLKSAGNRVERVLRTYLASVESCSSNTLTSKGEEICADMANLQLGSIIRKNKEHIIGLIAVAEKELKAIQRDVKETGPIVRKWLEALQTAKELMMQGGAV